jgi:hypothetical protein
MPIFKEQDFQPIGCDDTDDNLTQGLLARATGRLG